MKLKAFNDTEYLCLFALREAQTGLFNLNSFLFACLNNVQEELSPVWALALAPAPTYVKMLR